MPIEPGELDKRVTIERPPTARDRDAYGAPATQWQQVAEVWARVRTVGAREFLHAQAVAGDATTIVTIRWTPAVGRGMRISYRGRLLNVTAAIAV